MKSGPEQVASSPGAELPGEFVSEQMRADCARFLHDVWTRSSIRPKSGDASPANRTNRTRPKGRRGQDG